MASDPINLAILFGSVMLGIMFGAMPGLTSTLGVALLTAMTYGMDTASAMVCLLAIYVGGTYGGSYASILINIPGTAASAATALDGYPLACKGEGGRAIGLTTTASAIGTIISMLFLVSISPLISFFALQFTSFEFFLLAFFGILISGTLTSPDLVIKGWISGFLGLFLACVGRDLLQFYPRFTFGISELDSGIEVVPVLIGAFGIPQIIQVLKERFKIGETQKFQRFYRNSEPLSETFLGLSDPRSSVSASVPSRGSGKTLPPGCPTGPPRTPPNIRKHLGKEK